MGKPVRNIDEIASKVIQQYLKVMKDFDHKQLQKEADKLVGYLKAANLEIRVRGK